jgi:hypothetical protein
MLRLPDPSSQSAVDRLKPLENANPRLHDKTSKREIKTTDEDDDVTVSRSLKKRFDVKKVTPF